MLRQLHEQLSADGATDGAAEDDRIGDDDTHILVVEDEDEAEEEDPCNLLDVLQAGLAVGDDDGSDDNGDDRRLVREPAPTRCSRDDGRTWVSR